MRKTPLRPGTAGLERRARPRQRRRPSEQFRRIYGSPSRAKKIRLRPCDHCGLVPDEDFQHHNAHTATGGTGYKAGWETVVTLCPVCHRVYGWLGSAAEFFRVTGTDLRAIAARLAVELPA